MKTLGLQWRPGADRKVRISKNDNQRGHRSADQAHKQHGAKLRDSLEYNYKSLQ